MKSYYLCLFLMVIFSSDLSLKNLTIHVMNEEPLYNFCKEIPDFIKKYLNGKIDYILKINSPVDLFDEMSSRLLQNHAEGDVQNTFKDFEYLKNYVCSTKIQTELIVETKSVKNRGISDEFKTIFLEKCCLYLSDSMKYKNKSEIRSTYFNCLEKISKQKNKNKTLKINKDVRDMFKTLIDMIFEDVNWCFEGYKRCRYSETEHDIEFYTCNNIDLYLEKKLPIKNEFHEVCKLNFDFLDEKAMKKILAYTKTINLKKYNNIFLKVYFDTSFLLFKNIYKKQKIQNIDFINEVKLKSSLNEGNKLIIEKKLETFANGSHQISEFYNNVDIKGQISAKIIGSVHNDIYRDYFDFSFKSDFFQTFKDYSTSLIVQIGYVFCTVMTISDRESSEKTEWGHKGNIQDTELKIVTFSKSNIPFVKEKLKNLNLDINMLNKLKNENKNSKNEIQTYDKIPFETSTNTYKKLKDINSLLSECIITEHNGLKLSLEAIEEFYFNKKFNLNSEIIKTNKIVEDIETLANEINEIGIKRITSKKKKKLKKRNINSENEFQNGKVLEPEKIENHEEQPNSTRNNIMKTNENECDVGIEPYIDISASTEDSKIDNEYFNIENNNDKPANSSILEEKDRFAKKAAIKNRNNINKKKRKKDKPRNKYLIKSKNDSLSSKSPKIIKDLEILQPEVESKNTKIPKKEESTLTEEKKSPLEIINDENNNEDDIVCPIKNKESHLNPNSVPYSCKTAENNGILYKESVNLDKKNKCTEDPEKRDKYNKIISENTQNTRLFDESGVSNALNNDERLANIAVSPTEIGKDAENNNKNQEKSVEIENNVNLSTKLNPESLVYTNVNHMNSNPLKNELNPSNEKNGYVVTSEYNTINSKDEGMYLFTDHDAEILRTTIIIFENSPLIYDHVFCKSFFKQKKMYYNLKNKLYSNKKDEVVICNENLANKNGLKRFQYQTTSFYENINILTLNFIEILEISKVSEENYSDGKNPDLLRYEIVCQTLERTGHNHNYLDKNTPISNNHINTEVITVYRPFWEVNNQNKSIKSNYKPLFMKIQKFLDTYLGNFNFVLISNDYILEKNDEFCLLKVIKEGGIHCLLIFN